MGNERRTPDRGRWNSQRKLDVVLRLLRGEEFEYEEGAALERPARARVLEGAGARVPINSIVHRAAREALRRRDRSGRRGRRDRLLSDVRRYWSSRTRP